MKDKIIQTIYEDSEILVINKPAGVSVTKDRSGDDELSDLVTHSSNLLLVHRLDKPTSGVMILAKNKDAQRKFSEVFSERLIKKTYLAIVAGVPSTPYGTINAPIAPVKKGGEFMQIDRTGKEAVTQWKLLADFGFAALLEVTPLTGRTHQIRVHLKSIGFPLAIDPLYGTGNPLMLSQFKSNYKLGIGRTEIPLIERLTLHAYQIEFTPPIADKPEFFIAPLDKKFAGTIKMLTKYNINSQFSFTNIDNFNTILKSQKLST